MTLRFKISIPVSGTQVGKAGLRDRGVLSSSTGQLGRKSYGPF
jgi:hypothetical protein